MTVYKTPPVAGESAYENYCPRCGARAMISFAPNQRTLRYECDLCDYECDVPKRLPRMVLSLEEENGGEEHDRYDDED